MFIAGIGVWLLLLRGIEGLTIPPTAEEERMFQLTKRTSGTGHEFLELNLNKRNLSVQKDESPSLQRRQKVLEKPTKEEIDQFKKEFWWDCGDQTIQEPKAALCTIQELYGMAQSLLDRKQSYEDVTGWSTRGMISLGNKPNKPEEFAECTPIQCAGSDGSGQLELCAREDAGKFTYGFGLERGLIAKALVTLKFVCGWGDDRGAATEGLVPHFEFGFLGDKFKQISVSTKVGARCDTWKSVSAVCKSTDDKSKSQCLAMKSLFGVPWTLPQPTKTTPAPKKGTASRRRDLQLARSLLKK
ncbi:hypothetical protein ABW20_dc0103205 [Dactylellina cionopaga]|nr:hypothetical protein ABW20_dc0103205 [Dactylellina cionopaga]